MIDIFNVSELKGYTLDVNLILGAGMSLSDMMTLFQALSEEKEEFSYLEEFYNHLDLVAHIPVKNVSFQYLYTLYYEEQWSFSKNDLIFSFG